MKECSLILLIDGDPALAELVRQAFASRPGRFHLTIVPNLDEARTLVKESRPDLVIADWSLVKGNGFNFPPADNNGQAFPIVALTNLGGEDIAAEVMKAGAFDYMVKSEAVLSDLPHLAARVLREWRFIQDSKQAEQALDESEREKAFMLDSLTDHVTLQDTRLRFKWVNRAAAESAGVSPKDLVGRYCYQVWRQSDEPCAGCPVLKTIQTGRPNKKVMTSPNGRVWSVRSRPVRGRDGHVSGAVEIATDITRSKLAGEETKKFKTITDKANYGVIVADLSGKILYVNKHLADINGFSPDELPGRNFSVLYNQNQEPLMTRLKQRLEKGGDITAEEVTLRRKDGSAFPALINAAVLQNEKGRPAYFSATAIEISDKKKLENQLRQAQKREAIGTLAGGIAHDFNNILGGITGYTELALMDMAPEDQNREYLDQVLKAGDRAKNLVKQILAFSRQAEPELKAIKISPTVKEALKLLRASLPTTIEIKQRIDPDIGAVIADPTQVHQVLMNLCTNAAHAMRTKGGVLEVRANEVDIDADTAAQQHDLRPGRYARLTVCDNGQGMSQEVLERIFDPFFTTKARGQGTGMGLAVAHGIVKSHGGAIKAYSEAGKGSNFQVFLPVTPLEPREIPRAREPIPMGFESILFVDDEKTLVDVGRLVLERLGYRVDGRTSSLEAFKAFQTHPEKYNLVITDQTMPQMTGVELAEKLLLIRPDIPIILCTGFSESVNPDLARDMNIRRLLMKPLIASELGAAIRKALDQAQ